MLMRCGAHKCTHNDNEGRCYAKVVNVRGEEAKTTEGTLCNSFVNEKAVLDAEFAKEFNSISYEATPANIECGAGNCTYNRGGLCEAERVHINEDTVSCETFVM